MSPGAAELMVAALARELTDDDVVGVGLGTVLALVAVLAARRTHAPGLEFTCGGALSPDLDGVLDFMRGPGAMSGRTGAWISHAETMEMAERQAFTAMFLRPAQVDGRGAVNVSRVGSTLLPGGVGAGDTPSLLPRVICYHTDHRPRSLPERVDLVTGPGAGDGTGRVRGIVTLVTDLCVIAYDGGRPRCRSIHAGQTAETVQAATGFPLDGLEQAGVTDAPSAELLAAIAAVDALSLRELDFRATRAAAEQRLEAALDSEIPITHHR